MYKIFLSLRYLRARKTNWIGVAGITVGVTAMILILSIMSGFLNESRKHLRGNLSDLIIQPAIEYLQEGGTPLIVDPQAMLEIIRADPRVESACPQLQWYGMLAQTENQRVLRDPTLGDIGLVSLVGIDVADEFATTDLRTSLENRTLYSVDRPDDLDDPFAPPADYRPSGRPLPSILLGEQLAAVWGLRSGDEVEIVTTTIDKNTGAVADPSNRRYVVSGTFRSGENEMDMQRVYMEREELGDLLGREVPFSAVLVKLKNYEAEARAVQADLHDALADAGMLHPRFLIPNEIRTWEDFRMNLLAAIQNEKTLMGIMLSLVIMVAGFTVFALLSMTVSEKRRDIGILTALGSSSRGVMIMFLMIGLWEAIIGTAIGTTLGIWSALKIDTVERWLSDLLGIQIFNRDVYLFDHIPSVIEPLGVTLIVISTIVSTLLFAAIPAWRAARLHPIDALRYE